MDKAMPPHITTCIFDLGNVILTNDWYSDQDAQMLKKLEEYYGITPQMIGVGWEASWPLFRIGKITEDMFWLNFLRISDAKRQDIEYAKKIWRQYQKPIENMLFLLKDLKKKYRLIAFTNISKEWLDYKKVKFQLDSYFEFISSSGYYGFAKPDPKFYEILRHKLQIMGVKPEECLYIDDSPENLPPAKALGIQTLVFMGQKDLETKYREMSGI